MRVFWLDRDLLMSNIRAAAIECARRFTDITRIVLFGSIARGAGVPGSDVDLLIIVRGSDLRPLDRSSIYHSCFDEIGLGADLFVYTEDEAAAGNIPLIGTALKTGIVLYG